MKKKKIDEAYLSDLKYSFAEILLRELEFETTEEGIVCYYDINSNNCEQFAYKDRLLKMEDEFGNLYINPAREMEFNPFDNSKITEILLLKYLTRMLKHNGITILSITHNKAVNSNRGVAIITYKNINGETLSKESDPFYNESVRLLNLVCKINGSDNMYDFDKYDIREE